MLQFHCHVQSPGDSGLAATFERVLEQFSNLPRMFVEPDGSFVWRGTAVDGQAWQVDGNLIDQGAALAYVELNGGCPPEQFEQLLAALGWPDAPVEFQLPRLGVVLDESEFRRRAASAEGAG